MARAVFLADSISVCLSSGAVVRGSMTSALMPISASASAAASATCTMLLVATIVMSLPDAFDVGDAERNRVLVRPAPAL